MGNDGGSIPGRRDLVKEMKRKKKIKADLIATAKSSYCNISKEPLRKPIAACRLGNLYNYETVLKCLYDKTLPKCFDHIKRRTDVRVLNAKTKMDDNINGEKIVCPISENEYNGFHKFILMWKCGCVLSEKAFQELSSASKENVCVQCGTPYEIGDIVSLNQSKEHQEELRKNLKEEKEKKKKARKEKKHKRKNVEEEKESLKKVEPIEEPPVKKIKVQDGTEEIVQKIKESNHHHRHKHSKKNQERKEEIYEKIKNQLIQRAEPNIYDSLFTEGSNENLDRDFISRSVHHGLR